MVIEWNFILRILVAGLLGGLIGLERGIRAKEAGVRTHFIVALGSALFMLISQYAFDGRFDSSRVAAQVVSGIGFIGAGVIIFQKNAVRGITTASGLWVAAAVGLACGAKMYSVAIAASLLTVLCLELFHFISRRTGKKTMTLSVSPVSAVQLSSLMDAITNLGVTVDSFTVSSGTAVLILHLSSLRYQAVLKQILSFCEGYNVEIS